VHESKSSSKKQKSKKLGSLLDTAFAKKAVHAVAKAEKQSITVKDGLRHVNQVVSARATKFLKVLHDAGLVLNAASLDASPLRGIQELTMKKLQGSKDFESAAGARQASFLVEARDYLVQLQTLNDFEAGFAEAEEARRAELEDELADLDNAGKELGENRKEMQSQCVNYLQDE